MLKLIYLKGKRKEEEEEDAYEIVKMTTINDYLEQGKEKHAWGHSSLPRLSRIVDVKIEGNTVFWE
jgi:hypothetical protein